MFRNMMPDIYIKSIYHLDLDKLYSRGIRALLIDLDNTLVTYDTDSVSSRLMSWIEQLLNRGFKVLILSNNIKRRVSKLAVALGLPFIHMAGKPLLISFRRALRQLRSTAGESAIIGDQLFTDILGGNRMGMLTILVTPISHCDSWMTRVNRGLERLVWSYMQRKGIHSERKYEW